MSVTIKFIILYLIPVISFAGLVGVYFHGYGKSPGETFVNSAFFFVVLGFIASCFIAISLITQFTAGETIYTGIVFSILAWLIEIIVLVLYRVVFYGLFNP